MPKRSTKSGRSIPDVTSKVTSNRRKALLTMEEYIARGMLMGRRYTKYRHTYSNVGVYNVWKDQIDADTLEPVSFEESERRFRETTGSIMRMAKQERTYVDFGDE